MENCAYDENGTLLTWTFSDYTPITAVNMPNVKYGNTETPSPHSYSGAKGMGEGGGAPLHCDQRRTAGCPVPRGHHHRRFTQYHTHCSN